jgi:hypothetical protein
MKGKGNSKSVYVEVKTTLFQQRNVFEISLAEYNFAQSLPSSILPYYLFRVFGPMPTSNLLHDNSKSGKNDDNAFWEAFQSNLERMKLVIFKDIQELIRLGKIKLCLAV